MRKYNEQSSVTLTMEFTDELGLPGTPTEATYAIYNVTEDQEVKAETSIPVTSSTYDLLIKTDDNKIIDRANEEEEICVTFQWTYPYDKGGTKEFRYLLKNLKQIDPLVETP
jgi:hypothetical protein